MNQALTWTMSRTAVFDSNRIYVLAYSKREPGTRVFRWTGNWDNYYVQGVTAGICAIRGANPEILTLCADGRVHRAAPDGQSYEDLLPEKPSKHGLLRDIRMIGNTAYATGFGRQTYIRRSRSWQHYDQGMLVDPTEDSLSALESIDGFSESAIYASGTQGEIWHCKQGVWSQISSPTNIVLENILCAPDGVVYISGQLGIILYGRENSWSILEHDQTEDTFWDMTWFRGKLWLSTTKALYTLQDQTLEKVSTGLPAGQTFRYLDSNEHLLCSSGERDIALFDGASWTRIPCP
ncbi:hypothetical protein ACIGKL_16065 [Pseudomonas sp. NPDC077186]|uniref:hypothetical protein n=1 Tax=Pseudomonas sp. NPDC077186 TaxID=3364421 RepID=UPI0037C57F01